MKLRFTIILSSPADIKEDVSGEKLKAKTVPLCSLRLNTTAFSTVLAIRTSAPSAVQYKPALSVYPIASGVLSSFKINSAAAASLIKAQKRKSRHIFL